MTYEKSTLYTIPETGTSYGMRVWVEGGDAQILTDDPDIPLMTLEPGHALALADIIRDAFGVEPPAKDAPQNESAAIRAARLLDMDTNHGKPEFVAFDAQRQADWIGFVPYSAGLKLISHDGTARACVCLDRSTLQNLYAWLGRYLGACD